jgi:hypothetical protein
MHLQHFPWTISSIVAREARASLRFKRITVFAKAGVVDIEGRK